jgi:hypothetical protein
MRHARLQNLAFLSLAFAVLAFAMFPGRFDGDAISAYHQGLNFYFTDATSVWTSVLMGATADFAPGPAPMFLLQLLIWIGGLLLLTDALIATGSPLAGQAISLLAVTPLLSFDFFDVQKDAFVSALLVVLIAVGVRRLLLRTRLTLLGVTATAFVLLLALDARHNALFALFPMVFLYWPVRTFKLAPWLTRAGAGVCLLAAAQLALGAVNYGPFKSERAHFAYALIVYDLAGISVRIHQDASQGRLPGFLAEAERCYSPHEWDAFQGGACESTGLATKALMRAPTTSRDLVLTWAHQLLRHPVAYAAHRTRHFGCLISVGCQREHQLMNANWWVRPWDTPHMRVSGSARALGALGIWMWQGPLGSGALWLLVLALELAASVLALRRGGVRPIPNLTLVVSASGLSYLLSFAFIGIADQMRYLHPAIFLAVIALPLAATSLARRSGDRDVRDETALPTFRLEPVARETSRAA